ncbi:Fe(3+)-hydroxamate ABC transporter permease FhuB [Halomonas sp. DP8Y7-3]|uniref:Fe(3+)-hydroxamate ABC transporter permease FhuB n=1 Tax=Halomonas sp. DP8Y7-3 TaxID=2859079 RepID=UPI001C9720A4|nr:Fe(3+)-hydroxamate ABC transporter permease FhuB [Halomonas sp. DP8Y7-3]MBY5928153.1 Fe(3+)-hydroxamate ABC transporter permease FhuB [Halomonas sp. DP8Y7-3]
MQAVDTRSWRSHRLSATAAVLVALCLLAAWQSLEGLGGASSALAALSSLDVTTPSSLVLHYSWWPRLAIALTAGAALGLAGVLMQQVLRNPLAAPTTLGVASGANLALMIATLVAPGLLALGREWVALSGGALAMGLVFALGWRRGLSPGVVVLGGLVVNLYFGALAIVLLLFNQEALKGVLVWGAGSLAQNGWDGVFYLLPRVLVAGALAIWLIRPLALLELDDASAKSLGVSLKWLRLGGLGLAVFLTGCVVATVGIIGFIGLAAPNIARMAGARRLPARVGWSMLFGALLLTVTDLVLQGGIDALPTLLPTGATTAMLGAPLLLWLIPRLKLTPRRPPPASAPLVLRTSTPVPLLAGLAAALVIAMLVGILAGQTSTGWSLSTEVQVLDWRWPRIMAAAGSGALLAIAGTLIQRVTANPMASPELLGISGGTAIALIITIFVVPGPSHLLLLGTGTLGALVTLALLVTLNRASGFQPERLLLSGVAITALFDAVRSIIMVGGDPRGQQVMAWLSGSTYYVDPTSALVVLMAGAAVALAAQLLARWLDILPLGSATSKALGIHVENARLGLLATVAVLTAAATLIVGPLSFVGLLAPHMARLMGFSRARLHLAGAALIGALLMVLADWVGRQLLFPQEIPAGLVASILGGSYFMWGLKRL